MAPVLWTLYAEPLIRALGPGRVMQVGAGDGELSLRLLDHCRQSGCRADIIAPRPAPGLKEKLEPFAAEHAYFELLPLKAMQMAEHPDLVLFDDEPNWWTVTEALTLMRRLAAERGGKFPVFLLRHTGWPYARRDMYPKPEAVEDKHPFAYQGLGPDQPGLTEDGIDGRYAHALHEGGPKNGVLTAIEDFIANAPIEIDFRALPFFNGIGVLAPQSRMTKELKAAIDGLASPESLIEAGKALEAETHRLRAQLAAAETRLARRTQALKRARDLIARQEAEIAALGQKSGAKPKAGG